MAFQSEQGGDTADAAAVMRLVESNDSNVALSDHDFERGIQSLLAMLSWPEGKFFLICRILRSKPCLITTSTDQN
jgi:hypothetical protein